MVHNLGSVGAINLVKKNGAPVPPHGKNFGGKGPGPPLTVPLPGLVSRSLNSKNSLPFESTLSFTSSHFSCIDSWDPLKPKPMVRKKKK